MIIYLLVYYTGVIEMPWHIFHDIEINSPNLKDRKEKDLHTVSINDDYNDELFICIKRITGDQYGYAKFWEKIDRNFDLVRNLQAKEFDFFGRIRRIHILFRDARAEHYVYDYDDRNQHYERTEVYEEYKGDFLTYPTIKQNQDLEKWIRNNIG